MEPWKAVDAQNWGLEAHNRGLEGLKARGRRFASPWWGAGAGSALKLKAGFGSGSTFKWCGSETLTETLNRFLSNTGTSDMILHWLSLFFSDPHFWKATVEFFLVLYLVWTLGSYWFIVPASILFSSLALEYVACWQKTVGEQIRSF